MPRPRTERRCLPQSACDATARAAGLRASTACIAREPTWSVHRIAEAKSLALHVLAARRISADPALLQRARATVRRWIQRYAAQPPAALLEWQVLLEHPWTEVAARATALTEDGARLRQSSPLATLLSTVERRRVHEAFRA